MADARRVHCTWCGAVATGGRRFCAVCGKPVAEDDDEDDEDYDGLDYASAPEVTRSYYRASNPSRNGRDTESERPHGLLSRLGGGLAAVVAIPLALIMVVVSTAPPILVVLALIMGPGDTWSMLRSWVPGSGGEAGSGACEGFDDWFDASNERGNRLYARIEPVLMREVEDPAALRAISDDLRTGATAQRLSSPSTEAVDCSTICWPTSTYCWHR